MGDNPTKPRRVSGLVGTVARGPFATGSKSEREAVFVETDQGKFVLRRKDGPAFGDASLDGFVGKRVRCDGVVLGYTLIAESITPG